MLQRYKEIFYGLSFGLGAGVIDAAMHAQMEHGSFGQSWSGRQPAMVFYRVLFLVSVWLWAGCYGRRTSVSAISGN